MKIFLFILIFILILVSVSFTAEKPQITINKLTKNFYTLKNAKKIYVLFTFINTNFYDEPLERWFKENRNNKNDLLNYFYNNFTRSVNFDNKWGITLITNKVQAKSGYLIIANVQSILPVPRLGVSSKFSLYCSNVNTKGLVFTGNMSCFLLVNGFTGVISKKEAFKTTGERFGSKLKKFFKNQLK